MVNVMTLFDLENSFIYVSFLFVLGRSIKIIFDVIKYG